MSALAAYEAALRDEDHCWVTAGDGHSTRLPVRRWKGGVNRSDVALLQACKGLTLDVGCGPGRLTMGLLARGLPVLGIDVSAEAIRLAQRRGCPVLQRDFFDSLPGEGQWSCVLLADGKPGDRWRSAATVASRTCGAGPRGAGGAGSGCPRERHRPQPTDALRRRG